MVYHSGRMLIEEYGGFGFVCCMSSDCVHFLHDMDEDGVWYNYIDYRR